MNDSKKEQSYDEYTVEQKKKPIIDRLLSLKSASKWSRDSAEFTAIKEIIDILIDKEKEIKNLTNLTTKQLETLKIYSESATDFISNIKTVDPKKSIESNFIISSPT